jgi:outer membrane protein OmpA-like peptidoglycan-associated protein
MNSKVLLTLAAFVGWGFVSMSWWRNSVICPCANTEKANTVSTATAAAATLPYFFRGINGNTLNLSEKFPALIDSLKTVLAKEDHLLVKGYWYSNEDTAGIGDLGLYRANRLKDTLGKYFNVAQIEVASQFINTTVPDSIYAGADLSKAIQSTLIKDSSTSLLSKGKLIVYFPSNSTKNIFDATTEKNIADIIQRTHASGKQIQITGHTDSEGDEKRNRALGLNRANKLRAILIQRGVKATQITTLSMGETVPIASNDTEEGRAANRRAEVTIEQ